MDMNTNWKFTMQPLEHGHLFDLDVSDFTTVDLPHDYSITQPYSEEDGDGCTGYLLGGLGWYRKEIQLSKEMLEQKIFICFDGIYNRATIYLNEQYLTFHPYGYSPCLLDVTDYVKEGNNILAVRVDHTRYADSRWYTGSGIYRKVAMHVLPKLYIPIWGVQVESDVDLKNDIAELTFKINLKNECTTTETLTLETKIYDGEKQFITEIKEDVTVEKEKTCIQKVSIKNPILWDIYAGNTYTAITKIIRHTGAIQEKETNFGIRKIVFDANQGFFINGRNEKIKGVCLHHDAGLVGCAVPLDVWERRLLHLKACGCNAIRTAHNPVSADFLDLCDRLGFLVQEEFYDEWDNPKDKRYNKGERVVDYITRGHHEFFQEYAKDDMQNVMRRDFNHPSIIQWSIGNEIEWTYPKYANATGYFTANSTGNYFWQLPPCSREQIKENINKLPRDKYEMGTTAQKLADWCKEIDETRVVIANCILPTTSYETGYTDALDMVGYSYRQVVYEYGHTNYPEKPIMGTENLCQWHEWKAVLDKPYVPGIFLWTGIDYIGESGASDRWPRKALPAGLLDVAGFQKPSYYMFQSIWQDMPMIYMATQTLEKSLYSKSGANELIDTSERPWDRRLWIWHDVNEHYNYNDNEEIVVEMYSNCESITLYLNDVVVSKQYLKDFEDRIYKWLVPYATGILKAVGEKEGQLVECILQTATAPTKVKLKIDKTKITTSLDAVVHVEVQLQDDTGNDVKYTEKDVEFHIKGAARIFGVDNGSPDFVGDHHSNTIRTNRGKALLILGGAEAGQIEVVAKVDGNESEATIIEVVS